MIEKIELMTRFKAETEQQLQAIKNEDPELFLISVQECDDIIRQMNSLGERESEKSDSEPELEKLVSEIAEIRKQIASLLPALKSKLEQSLMIEKRNGVIQQGYGNEPQYVPSIFFDKKK